MNKTGDFSRNDNWYLDPPSDEEINRAFKLYKDLRRLAQSNPPLTIDYLKMLDEQREEVIGSFSKGYVRLDNQVIQCKSYIHVGIFIWWNRIFSRLRDSAPIFSNRLEFAINQPCLYRGQEKGWEPIPSLFRNDRAVNELALNSYEKILIYYLSWMRSNPMFHYLPPFSEKSARAVAQHYGVPTNFLDWTCQPDVALTFACGGKPVADKEYAVVMMLPLAKAIDYGFSFILPPVQIERLYAQRGMFLAVTPDQSNKLEDCCIKLFFPRYPHPNYNDLLPVEPYLRCLADWVMKSARGEMPGCSSEDLRCLDGFSLSDRAHTYISAETKNCVSFPFGNPNQDWVSNMSLVTQLLEMVEEVIYMGWRIDDRVASVLQIENWEIFDWLATQYYDGCIQISGDKKFVSQSKKKIEKIFHLLGVDCLPPKSF